MSTDVIKLNHALRCGGVRLRPLLVAHMGPFLRKKVKDKKVDKTAAGM